MKQASLIVGALVLLFGGWAWGNRDQASLVPDELDATTRREWIAFLMSRIDPQEEWSVDRPETNDVGLLLEVCGFGPGDVAPAVGILRANASNLFASRHGACRRHGAAG